MSTSQRAAAIAALLANIDPSASWHVGGTGFAVLTGAALDGRDVPRPSRTITSDWTPGEAQFVAASASNTAWLLAELAHKDVLLAEVEGERDRWRARWAAQQADAATFLEEANTAGAAVELLTQDHDDLRWHLTYDYLTTGISRDDYNAELWAMVNHGSDDSSWEPLFRYARARQRHGLEVERELDSLRYVRDMLADYQRDDQEPEPGSPAAETAADIAQLEALIEELDLGQ